MENQTDPPKQTLDSLNKYIHSRRFVGPLDMIKDYKLVAGILFKRFNERKSRSLFTDSEQPYILVTNWYDFSPATSYRHIPIDPSTIEQLKIKRVIEESMHFWGQWYLNNRGKKLVVEQWFNPDFITDTLSAGALIDIKTGEKYWS